MLLDILRFVNALLERTLCLVMLRIDSIARFAGKVKQKTELFNDSTLYRYLCIILGSLSKLGGDRAPPLQIQINC